MLNATDQYCAIPLRRNSCLRHIKRNYKVIAKYKVCIMDPDNIILFIGLDNGLDMDLIQLLVEEAGRPLPNYLNMQRGEQKARNENYYEEIIPRYTNDLFIEHFRMSRASFEILTNIIGNAMEHDENDTVPLRKKILFSIWLLAKPESFLSVGDRFGFSKSTGHGIFTCIINALTNLMPQFIKWPNNASYETISRILEIRSNGFPGVVGIIDGCHIPCKQPVGNPVDFYNRKGFHSIILQGICDHTMKFTDVFIGMPGRMHDARVFRNSPIFRLLLDVQPLIGLNYHIIADSAYPLLQNVMTPYRDNGHLTRKQAAYNRKLSSIRSTIERAFGLLKGKFRRLKYLDISDFDLGQKMIGAACILHNFIIDQNEINEEMIDDIAEANIIDNDERDFEEDRNVQGIRKRNNITDMF